MIYIYQIQFPNKSVRIGQTRNLKKRFYNYYWYAHSKKSKDYHHHLNNAIRKYGWKNLIIVIIAQTEDSDEADRLERLYIKAFQSTEVGYNIEYGGFSPRKRSPKTCKKISDSQLGELNHMFGKHHSAKTRKKISIKMKAYRKTLK